MDVLSDLLRAVRLSGAVFFRASFTAPWALASPESSQLAEKLLPAARRMILFHCIREGDCWVELGGGPREHLSAGDVVVFPFGDAHAMGSGEAKVESVFGVFPGPPPWPEPPRLVYGGDGPPTQLVCGFLHLDRAVFNPLMDSLPPVLVVRPDESSAGQLLRSSVEFLGRELDVDSPGASSILGRLTELLFVEVLRQHMAQLPESKLGWLAALRDAGIRRSLEAIHERPSRGWTVEELARMAGMSRSGFAARFGELLGESPAQYLTRWRIQLASQLLRDTDESIAAIAEAVGYGSEAAFSRAFKREVDLPPAQFRREAKQLVFAGNGG